MNVRTEGRLADNEVAAGRKGGLCLASHIVSSCRKDVRGYSPAAKMVRSKCAPVYVISTTSSDGFTRSNSLQTKHIALAEIERRDAHLEVNSVKNGVS